MAERAVWAEGKIYTRPFETITIGLKTSSIQGYLYRLFFTGNAVFNFKYLGARTFSNNQEYLNFQTKPYTKLNKQPCRSKLLRMLGLLFTNSILEHCD